MVIPAEFQCLIPVLTKAWKFECTVNPSAWDYNIWLLVDIRPVHQDHTQRNPGYHFDGFRIAGFNKGKKNTSIYSWCNKLPTRFYKGSIEFPLDFKPEYNANIITQKQIKDPNLIVDTNANTLYRFDGTTVHSAIDATEDINDRVFVRICFTAPDILFSRQGNSINPYLTYPQDWVWRKVHDPSISFRNLITVKNIYEFKNLWDVACQGHSAFSTRHEGRKALEHELIVYARSHLGPRAIESICCQYHQENTIIAQIRSKLLQAKYQA